MTSPGHRRPSSARTAGDEARPGDDGFTLIEILVAVIIMGLVFLVVLTGIFAAVRITDTNRKHAEGDRLVRDLAEQMKASDIGSTYEYRPCASPASYPAYTPPEPHEDWRVEITQVEYRNSANPTQWTSTCSSTTTAAGFQDDGGAQRITITARPPADVGDTPRQTIVVIKRDTRGDGS